MVQLLFPAGAYATAVSELADEEAETGMVQFLPPVEIIQLPANTWQLGPALYGAAAAAWTFEPASTGA